VSVDAVSLSDVLGCEGTTAEEVLSIRDWFEMVWSDAGSVPAEVVNGKSVGDWLDQEFIDCSVSKEGLVSPANLSVACWRETSLPFPAPFRDEPHLWQNPGEELGHLLGVVEVHLVSLISSIPE
jgi:hypothetical protein